MKSTVPLIPYFPISAGAAATMRELLPHMVAWLRAREAAPRLTLHPHRPARMEQHKRAA